MWSSLESVFATGDIARHMPAEAKKFMRVDKEWGRLMAATEQARLVVQATNSEQLKYVCETRMDFVLSLQGFCVAVVCVLLIVVCGQSCQHLLCACCRSSLPLLFAELERCQRSLEGYIERKRTKFPRLYFVSNPVLLQILSQGSDPKAIQPYYEKMFDAVTGVVHDQKVAHNITHVRHVMGKDFEEVPLANTVAAGLCVAHLPVCFY